MVHLQLSALADFVKAAIYIDKSVINAELIHRGWSLSVSMTAEVGLEPASLHFTAWQVGPLTWESMGTKMADIFVQTRNKNTLHNVAVDVADFCV